MVVIHRGCRDYTIAAGQCRCDEIESCCAILLSCLVLSIFVILHDFNLPPARRGRFSLSTMTKKAIHRKAITPCAKTRFIIPPRRLIIRNLYPQRVDSRTERNIPHCNRYINTAYAYTYRIVVFLPPLIQSMEDRALEVYFLFFLTEER